MFYDSQFYEYRALCYVAKKYNLPLTLNYKLPDFSLPISRRIEFDGYFEKEDIAVEIKSFPITNDKLKEIDKKYKSLNIQKLVVVSPGFPNKQHQKNLDILEYQPVINFPNKAYFPPQLRLPKSIGIELASGKHNFRFRLAKRSKNNRSRYLNQVDKKIDSIDKLEKEISNRIPNNNPPIKVLWSTKRWVSPKDHFYKKRNNLYLGGPIVFDIDGPKTHGAFKPCTISPGSNLCDMCIFFAKKETQKLLKILDWSGFRNIEVFFSGRSGFHIYVFDENENKLNKASKKFFEKKIKFDEQVTYSIKSEIAFPLTVNELTGLRIKHITNINKFKPEQ